MSNQAVTNAIDPQHYRKTMGRYPTGVALVSSLDAEENPVGMIVGTFASVSLDPPLVSFMPAKSSTTWPKIQQAGKFAISVLGANQESVVRAFGGKTATKFESVEWEKTAQGNPIAHDAIAWIECTTTQVIDAGDHHIVIGAVQSMDIRGNKLPLLFFQGGFGKFTPHSMAMFDDSLHQQLTTVDQARAEMENLAEKYNCGCLVGGKDSDSFVLLASAGSSRVPWMPSAIGRRVTIKAPFGRTCMAFAPETDMENWLHTAQSDDERHSLRTMLEKIRERGYSVSVLEEGTNASHLKDIQFLMDPGVESLDEPSEGTLHSLAIPLPSPGSGVPLVLSLYGLDIQAGTALAQQIVEDLKSAVHRIKSNNTTQN